MRNTNLLILFVIGCITTSFSQSKKEKEVPYTVAQRYFVKNTLENGIFYYPKITNQTQFDSLFGMAAVMGEGGTPTQIDFEKQFVIASIDEVSNQETKMDVKKLSLQKGKLILQLNKTKGEMHANHESRALLLVVVDKKNEAAVEIWNGTNENCISFRKANNYFVKNTVEEGRMLLPKITTQEELDTYFGGMYTMSENGQPTPIDFTTHFVVAFIDSSTTHETNYFNENVTQNGKEITYSFHKKIGSDKEGATFRYCLLIILPNKDVEKVNINCLTNK